MEKYTNSLIRKHRKVENRIASGHDDSEQIRELKELQRSLAERIRNNQRGAQRSQASDTA